MPSLYEQILQRHRAGRFPELTEGKFEPLKAQLDAKEMLDIPTVRQPIVPTPPRVRAQPTPETPAPAAREPRVPTPKREPRPRPEAEPSVAMERPKLPMPIIEFIQPIARQRAEENKILDRVTTPNDPDENIPVRQQDKTWQGLTEPRIREQIDNIIDNPELDPIEKNAIGRWLNNLAKDRLTDRNIRDVMRGKKATEDDLRIFGVAPGSTNPITGKTMAWHDMQRMFIETPEGKILPYDDYGYWLSRLAAGAEMGVRAGAGLLARAGAWTADNLGLEGLGVELRRSARRLNDRTIGIFAPEVEEKRIARHSALATMSAKYSLLEQAAETTFDIMLMKAGMKALGVGKIPGREAAMSAPQLMWYRTLEAAGKKASGWSKHIGNVLKSEKTARWGWQMGQMGAYGFATTPSDDLTERWQRARMLMVYSTTPYIATTLGRFMPQSLTALAQRPGTGGIPIFMIDAALNVGLTAPQYKLMAEEHGWFTEDWWLSAMPSLALDIWFAWDTRNWPISAKHNTKAIRERADLDWSANREHYEKMGYTQEQLRASYLKTAEELAKLVRDDVPMRMDSSVRLQELAGFKKVGDVWKRTMDISLDDNYRLTPETIKALNEHFGLRINTDNPTTYLKQLHLADKVDLAQDTLLLKTSSEAEREMTAFRKDVQRVDWPLLDVARRHETFESFAEATEPELVAMRDLADFINQKWDNTKTLAQNYQWLAGRLQAGGQPRAALMLKQMGVREPHRVTARYINDIMNAYMNYSDRWLELENIYRWAHKTQPKFDAAANRGALAEKMATEAKKIDPNIDPRKRPDKPEDLLETREDIEVMKETRDTKATRDREAELVQWEQSVRAETAKGIAHATEILRQRTDTPSDAEVRAIIEDIDKGDTARWNTPDRIDSVLHRISSGRRIDMKTSAYAEILRAKKRNNAALAAKKISVKEHQRNEISIRKKMLEFAEAHDIYVFRNEKGAFLGLAIDPKTGFYAHKDFADQPFVNFDSKWASLTYGSLVIDGIPKGGGRLGVAVKQLSRPQQEAIASTSGSGGWIDHHVARVNRFTKEFGLRPAQDGEIISRLMEDVPELDGQRISIPTAESLLDTYRGTSLAKGTKLRHWQGAVAFRNEFNYLIGTANPMLKALGLDPIVFRKNYVPMLEESKWWGLFRSDKKMRDKDWIVGETFHQPDAKISRHAMERARESMIKHPERNIFKLYDAYIMNVGKSIYHTAAIKQMNIALRALEQRSRIEKEKGGEGYDRSIEFYRRHMREGLLDRPGDVDIALGFTPGARRRAFSDRITEIRVRGALVGKLAWMLATQTSSAALTMKEAGTLSALYKGTANYFLGSRTGLERSQVMRLKRQTREAQQIAGALDKQMAGAYVNWQTRANDIMSLGMRFIETHITGWSWQVGYERGKQLGYKGEDLLLFADVVAERSQSLYNRGSRATALNNSTVRALFPFQSFSIEMFSHAKDLLGAPKAWKMDAQTRTREIIGLIAGISLFNWLNQRFRGRYVYTPGVAAPFVGPYIDRATENILGLDRGALGGREEMVAVEGDIMRLHDAWLEAKGLIDYLRVYPERDTSSLARAAAEYIADPDNHTKFRRELIHYAIGLGGLGGAGQINAMIDGIIASNRGYIYDEYDRLLVIDKPYEKFLAVTFGPWQTRTAQEYRRESKEIRDLHKEQDKMREDLSTRAEQTWNIILDIKQEEGQQAAVAYWNEIRATDIRLADAIDTFLEGRYYRLSDREKQIRGLNVKNGMRARAIYEYLLRLDDHEERMEQYRDWVHKKLISPEVDAQLAELFRLYRQTK